MIRGIKAAITMASWPSRLLCNTGELNDINSRANSWFLWSDLVFVSGNENGRLEIHDHPRVGQM